MFILFTIQESTDGGFTAKALDYPIFTEGDDLNELKTNIKEAVDCHFEQGNDQKFILINH